MGVENKFLRRDTDLIFGLDEYLRSVPNHDLTVFVCRSKHISLDDAEPGGRDLAAAGSLMR